MNKILRISIVVVICLIVILGVALIIGQCSKKPDDTTAPTTPTTPTTQPTTKPTTPPAPECTEHVDADTNYVCDNCGEELEIPADFTPTNDKVYVITSQLNVRSSASNENNDNVIAYVTMDTELERLGYTSDGWSKIIYDGEECFVGTASVTTHKPITEFEPKDERVYLLRNEKVYSKPSLVLDHDYSEEMDTLFKDTQIVVTRKGIATVEFTDEDGTKITFAQITYQKDGVEVTRYIDNSALTTEAPADPDCGITFEEDTSVLIVIADQSINLRTSAEYVDGNVGAYAFNGNELQATHRGVEGDGTVWYKVLVGDETYYVIFKDTNLKIKDATAQ